MSFLRKDFPGRYAIILLSLVAMLLVLYVLDKNYMDDFVAVDAIYLVPIALAAIFLGPVEAVVIGLMAMILSLVTVYQGEDVFGLNLWTSTALGLAGIIAAFKATIIRRIHRSIRAPREALDNSPLAYAEFKFPGYGLLNYNQTFADFMSAAGGKPGKTLFDSFPENATRSLAKLLDQAAAENKRVDCDELHVASADGRSSFW